MVGGSVNRRGAVDDTGDDCTLPARRVFALDRNGTNRARSLPGMHKRQSLGAPVRAHHEAEVAQQGTGQTVGRGHLFMPMRRIG